MYDYRSKVRKISLSFHNFLQKLIVSLKKNYSKRIFNFIHRYIYIYLWTEVYTREIRCDYPSFLFSTLTARWDGSHGESKEITFAASAMCLDRASTVIPFERQCETFFLPKRVSTWTMSLEIRRREGSTCSTAYIFTRVYRAKISMEWNRDDRDFDSPTLDPRRYSPFSRKRWKVWRKCWNCMEKDNEKIFFVHFRHGLSGIEIEIDIWGYILKIGYLKGYLIFCFIRNGQDNKSVRNDETRNYNNRNNDSWNEGN